VSGAILFHIAAVVAGALSAPPSSLLERAIAERFSAYYDLIDQGYAYRYYAPEPPATPVVVAQLGYDDGRTGETVRLPDRALRPRLLYQRHLALANALAADFRAAREAGAPSRWGTSYARHLCHTRGCRRVVLTLRYHQIPDPARVRETQSLFGANAVDLDADEFYTAPERIGEYTCDAF
jgi:hypothetical protein